MKFAKLLAAFFAVFMMFSSPFVALGAQQILFTKYQLPPAPNSYDQSLFADKIKTSTDDEIARLQRLWVELVNEVRVARKLAPVVWDDRLLPSTRDWNNEMIKRNAVTHARADGSSMHSWIKKYDLPFADDYADNYFTENIIRLVPACVSGCKQSLETELRSRFAYFMSEEKYKGSHFRTIVHADFTQVAVVIGKRTERDYYGTIHFARLVPEDRKFEDVDSSHTNFTAINELAARSVITGQDGYFAPDRLVTRAEFLKMLFASLKVKTDKIPKNKSVYQDVEADAWYKNWVDLASYYGLVSGQNGYFEPNKSISRAELLKILLSGFGREIKQPMGFKIFKDVSADAWYEPFIAYGYHYGLLDFKGENFAPDKFVTRAEVAQILYNLLILVGEVKVDNGEAQLVNSEVDMTKEAYLEMLAEYSDPRAKHRKQLVVNQ